MQHGKPRAWHFRQSPLHHRTHREKLLRKDQSKEEPNKDKAQDGETLRVISNQEKETTGHRMVGGVHRKTWWTEKPRLQAAKQVVLQIRIVHQKLVQGFTMISRICPKTEIAKHAKGQKLQGPLPESVPAVTYRALKTLGNEECESRKGHRNAVMEQDSATRWLQASECKTKTSHETEKSLQKCFEPKASPKVMYTENSFQFVWDTQA